MTNYGSKVVEVLGTQDAEHRVTISRIPSPSGTGWQAAAHCSCDWQTVDVTPALTLLKVNAHLCSSASPNTERDKALTP
jgi:hypothetical protein